MEVSMTGFQMVKLGNFKEMTKMFFPDLWMEDSWMHTKCCAALHQNQQQELPRSRAKNNKISILGHDGGYMIPTHSRIGQELRLHFVNFLDEHGKNELIPVCLENDTPNFYLNREVKSEETHSVRDAEQYFENESQQSGNG